MLFLSLILRPAMKNIALNVEDIPSRDQKSSLYTKTSWFGWMATYHSPYVKWKLKINLCNCAIILSFLKKVKDQRKWSIFQCFYFSNKIWEPVLLSEIKMYLCLRYENLRIGNKINKFTPDHIYFPPNRERLPLPL